MTDPKPEPAAEPAAEEGRLAAENAGLAERVVALEAEIARLKALVAEVEPPEPATEPIAASEPIVGTEPAAAIELRGATRHYRTRGGTVRAVNGVDLRVEEGECVAIMGPSGSGKSTLLAILGGLEVVSSGTAEVLGTDWASLSDERKARFRRQNIGFIFQDLGLLPFLTATENVAFGIGVAGADVAREPRVGLAELGLETQADRLSDQLSGGERGRVAIARSLAHRPALVLADEPTGNLDAALSEVVIRAFLDAVREIESTAVVVTHDPTVAARFDRTIRLRDGRVVDETSAASDGRDAC